MAQLSLLTSQSIGRQVAGNWIQLERSLKRLSSGQRIERASDDSAGLSIATRLRSQVQGYEQAMRNLQDAGSLLSTAEGGLASIQDSLQRLRELAVQAANDTLTPADREALQAEADQLRHGINRTAMGTEFNTIPVLRGKVEEGSAYQPKVDAFNRGRSQTFSATANTQTYASTSISSAFQASLENVSRYTTSESLPGWSPDDSRIEAYSDRDGRYYTFNSAGGTGSLSPGGTYTRDTVRIIGGARYELSNFTTASDGSRIYDGLYVSKDGGPAVQLVSFINSVGVSMSFSNDGSRIAYAAGSDPTIADSDLYVESFDPSSMSTSGRALVNQDGDTLNVPSTYLLGNPPAEWYTRSDAQASIKVFANSATGPSWEISADPLNGFTVAADRRSISLHGTGQIDSNDILSVYYQTDYGMVTNLDDRVSIKPSRPYEVYGLGTPAASVIIERNGSAIAYDPSHTNGFDYDPSTGRFTLYGDGRPSGNDSLTVFYQSDRNGVSAVASNQDGVVDVQLASRPETYNLATPAPNKAMRVYVGGTEISYDPTNGYTYDVAANRVSLHGAGRPAAKDSVRVTYYQDSPSLGTNQDGELQLALQGRPDLYHLTDGSANRGLRLYVNGTELSYDATNGFTYDASTGIVTFHGTARPDVAASITAKFVTDGQPDLDYTLALSAPAGDYSPSAGSTVVTRNGAPVSQITTTDGSGNGYYLADGKVHLVGTSAPDAAMAASTTYVVKYVTMADNAFALSPDDSVLTASCPEHYMPPLWGTIIDEPTLTVTVDGAPVSADPINGYSLTKQTGPFLAGTQTFQDYVVTLNGGARLVGDGHTITVGYDVAYFAPQIRQFTFHIGAGAADSLNIGIPPVGVDELNLNDYCLTSAGLATFSLQQVDSALATVNQYRGLLGAQINRLSHQVTNAQTMAHSNAQAESRIRDLDMARESMTLARAQILQQSSLSLLAQANQSARGVLTLLGR